MFNGTDDNIYCSQGIGPTEKVGEGVLLNKCYYGRAVPLGVVYHYLVFQWELNGRFLTFYWVVIIL